MKGLRHLLAFFVMGVLILTSGCATSVVRSESAVAPQHVYPATAFDAHFFWDAGIKGENLFVSARAEDRLGPFARFAYGTGALIDLPFSITFDTLLLPVDLFKTKTPATTNVTSGAVKVTSPSTSL